VFTSRPSIQDISSSGDMSFFVRGDYDLTGPTWFYPDNFTKRDSIGLVNLRLGIDSAHWSVTAWGRNLTDEDYNSEWSPGP